VDPESKQLVVEMKGADDSGAFEATFATLGVIDHHGDVTLPGAFEDGKVVPVGPYAHAWEGLPTGKATIHASDERAWIDGQFNLRSSVGRDMYETAKQLGAALEWSYVFQAIDAEDGTYETDKGEVPVRLLKKLDVWSVDPVLRGAGINTRTDSIKSINRERPFGEHLLEIAGLIDAFGVRVQGREAARVVNGRSESAENTELIKSLVESLRTTAAALEKALGEPDHIDIGHEWAAFERTKFELETALRD